eukprot:CAMPEP_0176482074 /NCGR_PEP_ID=MMETSP0200_2-20121128/3175_1 /TAXON_ID=947934 /ORGANISM="Chaetoceros sp., Strain GSL56" /LENGTH=654 /DNA_ID=CAMNT_0017878353 /DNA_START=35 /DNA_END=1999 /DNA_ORIENTATION=+
MSSTPTQKSHHAKDPQQQQQHQQEEEDSSHEIVRTYLSKSGLDTSTISMDDFDDESLNFLKEWCNKNVNVNVRKDSNVQDKDHGAENGENVWKQQDDDSKNNLNNYDNKEKNDRNPRPGQLALELNDMREYVMSLTSQSMQFHKRRDQRQEEEEEEDDNDVIEDQLDVSQLEPWQRLLFQKLQRQQKSIEKCQKQIDALSNIVAVSVAMTQKREKEVFEHSSSSSIKQAETKSQDQTTTPQPAIPNNAHERSILSLLEHILDQFFNVPRAVYNYILSTRPVRIILLLRREAQDFRFPLDPNQRFLDVQLMIQLFFTCLFLRARIGSMQRRRGNRVLQSSSSSAAAADEWKGIMGELMAVWTEHGEVMLVIAAMTVYMIRTGLILFLYKVIFKDNVIARVMRDEDLPRGDGGDENTNIEVVMEEEGNNLDDVVVRGVPLHREEGQGLRRVRRGRRMHDPARRNRVHGHEPHGPDNGNQEEDNHANNMEANHHQQRPVVDRNVRGGGLGVIPNFQLNDTFVGGGLVDPPFDAEDLELANAPPEELFLGQMIEGFKDILYLIGSFFLSVIPLWWPKPREVRRNNNVHNNVVDGDDVPPVMEPENDGQRNQEEQQTENEGEEGEANIQNKDSNIEAGQNEKDGEHDNDENMDDARSET